MRALCTALLGLLLAAAAHAQYPTRPIKLLVPNPPGGATDTISRLIAPKLGEGLGQPILVDNRPGANGNQATEAGAKAAPDGYTMLFGADSQIVISPHLYSMSVDTLKDLVPISTLSNSTMMLTVVPSLPVKNLPEFIDYARKAKPPLTYASIGQGSQHHLAMEMVRQLAGLEMVHVPYKGGGPATVGMLAGDVAVMWGGNSVSGHIKSGKLKLIAVGGRERSPEYPDVQTVAETFPGFSITPWHALFFPAAIPQPILGRTRAELGRVLASPDTREKIAKLGGLQPFVTTPEEFSALLRSEYERYGRVVKTVGVKVD